MLRLIHNQTTQGAILVDDIDDGLPNKTAHRLGSTADPKAYDRDGYANSTKQKCYVPRTKPSDATIQGYIDLKQTDRVTLSAGKGKIKKLKDAGLITVVSLTTADLAAPTVASGVLDTPSAGDVTITGTNMLSVSPNFTTVTFTGTGAVALTQTQITTGGGTVSNTSIVIPAALIPSVVVTATSVKVRADDQNSATVALT